MCRWLAYRGEPKYLEELLYRPVNSLISQSMEARKAVTAVNGDGFGAAWYEEKPLPALYHEVLPAWSDKNLKSLSDHVISKCFMAHVRASTGANTSRLNCHPFNVDEWLFMHNGQIPDFEKVRFNLEHDLNEEYFLKRTGTTDSELIFLLLLQYNLRNSPLQALKKVINRIEDAMYEKGISEPFKAALCISNGNQFWALRYATNNQSPPTLYYKKLQEGIVLSSEPYEFDQTDWHQLDNQNFMVVDDEKIQVVAFVHD